MIRATDRKLRLFAVGCGRLPAVPLNHVRLIQILEEIERVVDGEVSRENDNTCLEQLNRESSRIFNELSAKDNDEGSSALLVMSCAGVTGGAAAAAEYAARHYCEMIDPDGFDKPRDQQVADLLRDIIGNPYHLITFSPSWRTDTAVTLARTMYESRDFSAMPILADALQDAGCDNEDILSHCRDTQQPHVRGCWVVDLVLGKN